MGCIGLGLFNSRRKIVLGTTIYVIFFYLWIFLWQDNKRMLTIGSDILQTVALIITLILLITTYKKISKREKKFWLFMVLGTFSYTIGMLIWSYYEIILKIEHHYAGYFSLFFALMYFFYLSAVFYRMHKGRSAYKSLYSIFDALIVMIAIINLSYRFIIAPMFQQFNGQSIIWVLLTLGSPVFDLTMLLGVLYLYFLLGEEAYYRKYILIFGGIFTLLIADSYYFLTASKGLYSTGSLYDPLWALAFFIIGISGLYSLYLEQRQIVTEKASSKINVLRISMPYVVVTISLTVELAYSHDLFSVGMVITMLLVIVKQILVIIDNKKLLQDVSTLNHRLESKVEQRTKELKESKQIYKSLYDQHYLAIYSLDLEGRITSINSACENLSGYSEKEILEKPIFDLIDKENQEMAKKYFISTVSNGPCNFEMLFTTKLEKKLELDVTCIPIIVDSKVTGIYGIIKDITEYKINQGKIHHMAFHDSLTSLPNRRFIKDKIEELMIDIKNNTEKAAVMFIDLDRFKGINDTLGHEMGDQLLIAASNRLKNCLRKSDIVARQGGDEFTVLLSSVSDTNDVIKVAEKIINSLSNPFLINKHELVISCSIGIAMFPDDGEDWITLMKNADAAMYSVKEEGRNGYNFYIPELNQINSQKFILEKSLKNAIKREELILYYQPQINTKNNEIIGAEALVRWNHPSLGLVPPSEFIALAEETGLILTIGEWILRAACKQMMLWQQKGYKLSKMGVNISVKQFQLYDFVEVVSGILKDTGLDGRYLELEITESIAMQNEDEVIVKILALKQMGISVSIDDFGTGYSSLSYLKKFPISTLKIAQQFVKDIKNDSDEEAIVSAIIAMANKLNINIIAEGVETESHVKFLTNQKCYIMQGYFFSRPLSSDKFVNVLERGLS